MRAVRFVLTFVEYSTYGTYDSTLTLDWNTSTALLQTLTNVTTLLGSLQLPSQGTPDNTICVAPIGDVPSALAAAFGNLREIRGALLVIAVVSRLTRAAG